MKRFIWVTAALAALAVLLWLAPFAQYVATYALFGPVGLFSTNPTVTAFVALAIIFAGALSVLWIVYRFLKIWD